MRHGDFVYPALVIRMAETGSSTDATVSQFELARDGVWMRSPKADRRVPTHWFCNTSIVFSGDLQAFDACPLAVVVGDVTGCGIPAAILMAHLGGRHDTPRSTAPRRPRA
jgi:hypothetical protein